MNFDRANVRSSPYVGVFASLSDDYILMPISALPKEVKLFEKTLEAKVIKTSLAGTSLLGILSKIVGNKAVVSSIVEDQEIKVLEKHGIEVLRLEDYTSTGNLIAMNNKAGVASPLLRDESIGELEKFLGIKFTKMRVADTDLAGACLTVTNKGFISHPNISEENFNQLKKLFGVEGTPTTANYGDLFVGNSVVANSKGVLVGSLTSGIELTKIDEGLRGDLE